MSLKTPQQRKVTLEEILHRGDPWVIVMQVTDGPLPTLLLAMGEDKPWSSKHRAVADRTHADLVKDTRVVKAEVMRVSDAVKVLTKAIK